VHPFSLGEKGGMMGSENQSVTLSNSLTSAISLGERGRKWTAVISDRN